jgi:hypothetical protein
MIIPHLDTYSVAELVKEDAVHVFTDPVALLHVVEADSPT